MNAIKERNIGVCILLTLVTCGIYGIFWFISLTDDMRVASGDDRLSDIFGLIKWERLQMLQKLNMG